MKTLKYLTLLIFLGMSVGCYNDKGNYDYKDIEKVSITFSPNDFTVGVDSVVKFVYKQPLAESVSGTISVEAVRMKSGEKLSGDNLEYMWVSQYNEATKKRDTIYGATLDYTFPPKKPSKFSYNLIVRDPATTLEFYRDVIVSTQTPYLNSWFVLHGDDGDVKLGTIEMGADKTFITQDTYSEINGDNRFQNATDMIYSLTNGDPPYDMEGLEILSQDSVYSLSPFKMQIFNTNNFTVPTMVPPLKFVKGVTDNATTLSALITEDKKILHSGKKFCHFYVKMDTSDPRTVNYSADDCFIDANGIYTIWDAKQRCFHYYNARNNWYHIGTDRSKENEISKEKMTTIPDNVWENNELVSRSLVRFSVYADYNGTVAIMKDNSSGDLWAYNISYGGKRRSVGYAEKGDEPGTGAAVNVARYRLTGVPIDKESPFATSTAYSDQFFYGEGNKLYRYNYLSGDRQEIYSTDDKSDRITLLRFASPVYHNFDNKDHFNRLLGIAVSKSDNTYELHSVLMAKSGDVESISEYGPFGKIKQITFSLQMSVH